MLLFPGILAVLVFTVDGVFRQARDEEFPFQVSIQNSHKEHLCGGVIIAPRWVLTSSICLRGQETVSVVYGSADVSRATRSVMSEKIEHEPVYIQTLKSRLAVIQIQTPIEVTTTSGQASLPMCSTGLKNTTKLSGWRAEQGIPTTLYVADTYLILTENCMISSLGGATVKLEPDEFCGMDEEKQNTLYNPGAVVTVKSIVLGMLAFTPVLGMPHIFLKLSKHEQWIKGVLGEDADDLKWVEKLPMEATTGSSSQTVISTTLLGISTFLLRLI